MGPWSSIQNARPDPPAEPVAARRTSGAGAAETADIGAAPAPGCLLMPVVIRCCDCATALCPHRCHASVRGRRAAAYMMSVRSVPERHLENARTDVRLPTHIRRSQEPRPGRDIVRAQSLRRLRKNLLVRSMNPQPFTFRLRQLPHSGSCENPCRPSTCGGAPRQCAARERPWRAFARGAGPPAGSRLSASRVSPDASSPSLR